MTSTTAMIRIEPLVRWPRHMTSGQAHLVEVDLRLLDEHWPYENEEFTFHVLLAGMPFHEVRTVGPPEIVVHRFGGSYGSCRFVVTPTVASGDHPLALSLETDGGAHVTTIELPVHVAAETRDEVREAVVPAAGRSGRAEHRANPAVTARSVVPLLAAHIGPDFSTDAVAAVAGVDLPTAGRLLAELAADGSVDESRDARYSLSPKGRGRIETTPADLRDAARRRLLDHYRQTGQLALEIMAPRGVSVVQGVIGFRDRSAARDWLDEETSNMAAYASLAAENGWMEHARELLQVLSQHLLDTGHHETFFRLCRRMANASDHEVKDLALNELADTYLELGRYLEAMECLNRVRELEASSAGIAGHAEALNKLGVVHSRLGQHERAYEFHQRALEFARGTENRLLIVDTCVQLGISLVSQGRLQEALARFAHARDLSEELNDQYRVALSTEHLAQVHAALGNVDNGRELWAEAAQRYRSLARPPTDTSRSDTEPVPGVAGRVSDERRLTEAIEQLASGRRAEQDVGIQTLETLARQVKQLRQTAVDELCRYVREFSERETNTAKSSHHGRVRHVLDILVDLSHATDANVEPTNIDLSGAVLPQVDFTDCRFGYASFNRAVFTRQANFTNVVFDGPAQFSDTMFEFPDAGSAVFTSAKFQGAADFSRAEFNGRASFLSVSFLDEVIFRDANFMAAALFTGGSGHGAVRFDDVIIAEPESLRLEDFEVLQPSAAHRWPVGWSPYTTANEGLSLRRAPEAGVSRADERLALALAHMGEPDALDEVIAEYSPLVWRVARGQGLDRSMAEDVVQATWMRLVQSLPRDVQNLKNLQGWLTSSAKREAWKRARQARLEIPSSLEWFEDLRSSENVEDDVADRMNTAPRYQAIWAALNQMSDVCRALIQVIAYTDRPDYDAVARQLGIARGSIGPTRGRCLAHLRRLLQENSDFND